MPQNNKSSRNFISHPLWTFLASIATILALIFAIFTWIIPYFNHGQTATPTSSTTSTQVIKNTSTSTATTPTTCVNASTSNLIPDQLPVLCDPLNDPNGQNQWFVGTHGSATCAFLGGTYQITAPSGTSGGECNTNAANTAFTNFVYQIKMTILRGLDGQGGVGPSFCMSSALNGSWYRVSFELGGYWTFGFLTGGFGNVKDTTITSGVSQYFLTQPGQANYITVRVQNHHIDAQVNGHQLFSTLTDTTLDGGMIGVQLGPGSQDADVAFSDALVWQV